MARKSSAPRPAAKTPPALVHKATVTRELPAVSEADRTVRFRVSTDDVDRERDIVEAAGWQVDDYLQNPVVLFGHDYRSLPVARALSLATDDHGLSMVAQFPPPEVYPFADTVYQMVRGGFLNATSVGFKPLDWIADSDTGGTRFRKQALIEVSICPVPANPHALVEARAAGIDPSPLKAWAQKVLDLEDAPPADEAAPDAPAVPAASDAAPEAALPEAAVSALDESPGEHPQPVVASAADPQPTPDPPVSKAGRVLSGRNESALRDAVQALDAALAQVRDVLAQVGVEQDEAREEPADEPAATPSAAADALQPVLTITDSADDAAIEKATVALRLLDDPEPRYAVTPTALAEALAHGVWKALVPLVEARVAAAISALRGRLD